MDNENANNESAIFAGGCFWCTEAVFKSLNGVAAVMPGYIGGTVPSPSYEKVVSGGTGHVEAIKIDFDPKVISYDDLLAVFFNTHDPTTPNRQGNDIGAQYRSVIFYSDETQREKAEELVKELTETQAYNKPIVTEILPAAEFYMAEEYHRDYYERNKGAAYCEIVIAPKLEKLRERFEKLLKR